MKIRAALSFLIIVIAFAANSVYSDELKIPVLVGQTGASANFGSGELRAYQMAADEWNARGGVNGKRVTLMVEDTQTSPQQIVSAYHRIALEKPAVILGPTWLDGFPAIIPLARKQHILPVVPSAAREAFSPEDATWPISFYHNSTLEIETLLAYFAKQNYSRVALVYEIEPFAEMIRKLVGNSLPNLVADVGVQAGTTGFQSIITNLKAKRPDILIVFVWDERSLLSLLQQLRVQMPNLPLATVHDGEGWLSNPTFGPNLPDLTHTKFLITDSGFKERFAKRYGQEPMLTTSNAYDALNAVLKALEAGKITAEEIREYLLSQTFETATFGTFKFNADGSVPSKISVVHNKR